jgi:hypothetical protein
VNLETKEDLHAFADLIGQPQLKNEAKTNLKSTWFPRLERGERGSNGNYIWVSDEDL